MRPLLPRDIREAMLCLMNSRPQIDAIVYTLVGTTVGVAFIAPLLPNARTLSGGVEVLSMFFCFCLLFISPFVLMDRAARRKAKFFHGLSFTIASVLLIFSWGGLSFQSTVDGQGLTFYFDNPPSIFVIIISILLPIFRGFVWETMK